MTIPMIIDLDELTEWFLDRGVEPTREELSTASCRVGRNAYLTLIMNLYCEDRLVPEVAAHAVPEAWLMADSPVLKLGMDLWGELFALAGFTIDGEPNSRLDEPVRLYRGAQMGARAGWAWTTDLEQARQFADRQVMLRRPSAVWTLLAPPESLFAIVTGSGEFGRDGESEYVVNTRTPGLAIEEFEPRGARAIQRGVTQVGGYAFASEAGGEQQGGQQ